MSQGRAARWIGAHTEPTQAHYIAKARKRATTLMTGTERLIWGKHSFGSKTHPRQLPPMQSGCTIGCVAERMRPSQFHVYAGSLSTDKTAVDTKGGKRLAKRQTYLLSMSPPR